LRSKARLRLGQAVEAAQDALRAAELEPSSAGAHAARGAALLVLEEYEGALAAFGQADALLKKDEEKKAPASSSSCCGGHHHHHHHDEEEAPKKTPSPLRRQVDEGLAKARAGVEAEGGGGASAPAAAAAAASAPPTPEAEKQQPPPPPPPPPPSVRRQWYQTPDRVVVDVFVKGVPTSKPDAVRAQFEPRLLRLHVDEAAGGPGAPAPPLPYELELPLWGEVDASKCGVEVLRSKLEVTLFKKTQEAWPFLDKAGAEPAVGVAAAVVSGGGSGAGVAAPAAPAAATASAPPAASYPSSRPPGARKDWSAVEAQVKAMEEQGELDDGDQLSAFFKKIFAGGDDETRRAMVKSYVESGGTVLSTNWKEVGEKKVEPTPPDGMEARKFE
jgi:suppressor of G2 allele of SKP1